MIAGLLGEKKRDEILLDYKVGAINFDLPNRFNKCLVEMRRREENTAIKLADYIEANYKYSKLFVTHNHPANALLFESVRQIKQITELPIKLEFTDLGVPELPNTNCPVSPHDKVVHGYEFAADTYWYKRGKLLIDKIIDDHEADMKSEPQKNEMNLIS